MMRSSTLSGPERSSETHVAGVERARERTRSFAAEKVSCVPMSKPLDFAVLYFFELTRWSEQHWLIGVPANNPFSVFEIAQLSHGLIITELLQNDIVRFFEESINVSGENIDRKVLSENARNC